MNQRPSRVPSPPPAETETLERDGGIQDATFHEVERPNSVPARRVEQQSNSLPSEGPVQQPTLPVTPFAKLAGAIAAVMAEIKPVEKSGWNDFHKYNYAKMGDLSIELTPLMGRNGIVVFQNEVDRAMFDDGKVISVRYQFTVVHSSGEIWPERPLITGMSRCRDSKGGFDDKAFNKAHTAARKYFLLSLFQIPTDDEHPDADASDKQTNGGGQSHARPQGRRQVPSPSGKIAPHEIEIINGEAPEAWATRFKAFIAKAETAGEVDVWYDTNFKVFDKIKDRFPETYDDLIAAMDDRANMLTAAPAKPDTISSGKANTDDFPGDIPAALDRRKKTFDVENWLVELETIYAQCDDSESLAEEQRSMMLPMEATVAKVDWQRAVVITKKHLDRIQGAQG